MVVKKLHLFVQFFTHTFFIFQALEGPQSELRPSRLWPKVLKAVVATLLQQLERVRRAFWILFMKGNEFFLFFYFQGEDVDTLLQDEMLDSCDSPKVRQSLRGSFLAIFAELCAKMDDITAQLNSYINDILMRRLDTSLLSMNMKLNPALESLKSYFQVKNINDPAEYEILNLIAGIITYSIPGALKECCSGDVSQFNSERFNSILLSCIEDSIKVIW